MRLRRLDLWSALLSAALLLLPGCGAAPTRHAPSAPPASEQQADVHFVGLRVRVPVRGQRHHANHQDGGAAARNVDTMLGCADVGTYIDIGSLYPSSQILFSNMVSGVCGTYNLFTMKFFGGLCTAACSDPGDWCDAMAKGTIVDSSDACNACATSYPPSGPMDKVLACGDDPLN